MKKRLAIMAVSALLAVAPIATVTKNAATTQTVKAAELTPAQLMRPQYRMTRKTMEVFSSWPMIKLHKKTPYLVVRSGETLKDIQKKKISDVTSNYGHVSKFSGVTAIGTDSKGWPDIGGNLFMKKWQKFKKGQGYVAVLMFDVNKIKLKRAIYLQAQKEYGSEWTFGMDQVHKGKTAHKVMLLVPIRVDGKKPTSNNFDMYSTVESNSDRADSEVKTYTSTGDFSGSSIKGDRRYHFTQKKDLPKCGYAYKLYGKDQWVPVENLTFR